MDTEGGGRGWTRNGEEMGWTLKEEEGGGREMGRKWGGH